MSGAYPYTTICCAAFGFLELVDVDKVREGLDASRSAT